MDYKEARDKLLISKDEEESIKRYQGFMHTSVNILSNMSYEAYTEMKSQGWKVPETAEELEKAIDDFIKIYSAMYKESSNIQSVEKVVRGTGNKEMSRLHTSTDQFLSTSRKEDIAKTFTRYGDSAIVRITMDKGTPHLNMSSYLNDGSKNEEEILIAPFCKINKKERVSDWDGYKYYQLDISKPELEEKTDEELTKLKEKVTTGFEQFIENMKNYREVESKIYVAREGLERGNIDDRMYFSKKVKEYEEQKRELYSSLYNYKSQVREYLEGNCRKKELEIDEALKVIDEEYKKREEERIKTEKIEKDKEQKLKESENLSKNVDGALSNSEDFDNKINELYKDLVSKQQKIEDISKFLQLSYNSENRINLIPEKIKNIEKVMQYINEKVEEEKDCLQNAKTEISEIEEKNTNVTEYNESLKSANVIYDNMTDYSKKYASELETQLKEDILKKSLSLIKNAKLAKYNDEYQKLENEKIGFFGKLFGKEALRQEKLKNIALKINSENIDSIRTAEETNNFSIRETLTELYIAGNYELGSEYNQEIRDYYESIREIFKSKNGKFTDEEINQLAQNKIAKNQSILPVEYGKKVSTKQQIEILKMQNDELNAKNGEKRLKQKENIRETLRVGKSDNITLISNGFDAIEGIIVGENQYYDLEDREDRMQKADPNKNQYDNTIDLWGKNQYSDLQKKEEMMKKTVQNKNKDNDVDLWR